MAVYTHVNQAQLEALLNLYDIGKVTSFTGISEGVENTNYFLDTDQGKYILTLYEKRVDRNDLPFFLDLMKHMAENALPAAKPVKDKSGTTLQELCGRAAAIIEFAPGKSHAVPSIDNCSAMGTMLARAHNVVGTFAQDRKNDLSLQGWHSLKNACIKNADTCKSGMASLIMDEFLYLDQHWPDTNDSNLPRGVIHADFFPDNVLFDEQGNISGLIDFYFSCTDFFVYDLAICINAWCFDNKHQLDRQKCKSLLSSYHKERNISDAEISALPIMLRGNSLRFLLTRLYDWLNRVDGALVNVKDPLEYEKKLQFHRTNTIQLTF